MKKPSSATSSGNSISPCVHVQQCQSIIVIVIPFSNLNRVFAMGILFRLVIGLVDTTSMGIPTLSLQVNQILTVERSLEANHVGVQVTVMLVCLIITNAQVILFLLDGRV